MSVSNQGVKKYQSFLNYLNHQYRDYDIVDKAVWIEGAKRSVDGLAAQELRRLVPLTIRRNYGAFFTPSELAAIVCKEMFIGVDENSVFYDAACGAGNLLIAAWQYLKDNKIKSTNNTFLFGTDIHQQFVEVSDKRLSIQKLLFDELERTSIKSKHFDIRFADGLVQNELYEESTHVFVNPPFNLMPVTDDITWSKGVASAAAIFIDKIIKYIKPGTRIIAILPEVLRSGSRYTEWRKLVLSQCINEKIKLLGQFDEHADIDVFALSLLKRTNPINTSDSNDRFQVLPKSNLKLSDVCKISVGPVVDNRDKHEGRRRGYIISKGLKGWTTQKSFNQTRQYSGKTFEGPFIVIKRTSRMGDNRAIAVIINTPSPVYVDNHLIILIPNSQTLEECEEILKSLRDSRTDIWLNKEIRCRHLTVKVVSNIPLWPKKIM